MRLIRQGSRGQDVRDVQQRLIALGTKIEPDELEGMFGPSTEEAVREFQRDRGLGADGIVGAETWGELVESGYHFADRTLYLRYPYFRGDDVRALQRRLNALGFDAWREDGIFGEHVDGAVREFQRNVGQETDGIVGPETYEGLRRLRPDTEAPSRALVREAEQIRTGASLEGAVIAIDPGHGPSDPGAAVRDGSEEYVASFAMASALATELSGRGAKPVVLRASNETPTGSERAKAANELGAAVLISLHVHPEGGEALCLYFGTAQTHSPAGCRLADLIRGQLDGASVETGAAGDARMAIAVLRETRMPAVQLQPALVPDEPGFARTVTRAIELFLAPADAAPSG